MAGKIIADIIEAPYDSIRMNVGNVTVLTANNSGLTYTPTGNVNINVGSTVSLTLGNVTVSSNISTGNIIASGVIIPNNGIRFPATQVASGDANTLDDYEEGTWTPTLTAESGSLSVTYTSNNGTYTKIGNLVTVRFQMRVSSHSGGSGGYRISGLPFVAQNPNNDHIGVSTIAYESHPIASGTQLIAVVDDNVSFVRFLISQNNASWTNYTPGSPCGQYGSFTYAI